MDSRAKVSRKLDGRGSKSICYVNYIIFLSSRRTANLIMIHSSGAFPLDRDVRMLYFDTSIER